MTRTTLGIVAATITAVLALAGCGSSQQPEHQSGDGHDHHVSLPAGDGPIRGDSPDVSAREALSRMYSWQPVTDIDTRSAIIRAKPWIEDSLHRKLLTGRDWVRLPGSWALWREDRAIVTAQVAITARRDEPMAQNVQRTAMVAQVAQWPDGSTTESAVMTYTVTLARGVDDRLRLTEIEVSS